MMLLRTPHGLTRVADSDEESRVELALAVEMDEDVGRLEEVVASSPKHSSSAVVSRLPAALGRGLLLPSQAASS